MAYCGLRAAVDVASALDCGSRACKQRGGDSRLWPWRQLAVAGGGSWLCHGGSYKLGVKQAVELFEAGEGGQ